MGRSGRDTEKKENSQNRGGKKTKFHRVIGRDPDRTRDFFGRGRIWAKTSSHDGSSENGRNAEFEHRFFSLSLDNGRTRGDDCKGASLPPPSFLTRAEEGDAIFDRFFFERGCWSSLVGSFHPSSRVIPGPITATDTAIMAPIPFPHPFCCTSFFCCRSPPTSKWQLTQGRKSTNKKVSPLQIGLMTSPRPAGVHRGPKCQRTRREGEAPSFFVSCLPSAQPPLRIVPMQSPPRL